METHMQTDKPSARGFKALPSQTTDVGKPALFRSGEVKFTEGEGTFAGLQVAVLSEDPVTGARAVLLKVPRDKKADPRKSNHFNTLTMHTFVIQGELSVEAEGKTHTGRAGDYFRAPAGWIHGDSQGVVGPGNPGDPPFALLLTFIEGGPKGAAGLETVTT
jgi:quercetin dioxygenase-like cupin family protein